MLGAASVLYSDVEWSPSGVDMDDDFKQRLDKIHDDHARFMALVESMPPLTEQQKEANRAKLFAEEEPFRIAKRVPRQHP
jgi:hypothetical protein